MCRDTRICRPIRRRSSNETFVLIVRPAAGPTHKRWGGSVNTPPRRTLLSFTRAVVSRIAVCKFRGTGLVPTATSDASRTSCGGDDGDDGDAGGRIYTPNPPAGAGRSQVQNPVSPTTHEARLTRVGRQ